MYTKYSLGQSKSQANLKHSYSSLLDSNLFQNQNHNRNRNSNSKINQQKSYSKTSSQIKEGTSSSQSQQLALISQINRLQPFLKKLAQQAKRSAITTFFGTTGTGKSALISYLLNAEMKYAKGKMERYEINHVKNNGQYPQIGHKKVSCTTIPTIYSDKYSNYVDLPGFFDTRSQNQEIINSICSSKLFSRNQKVKIVIVIQASQLSIQRGGKLVQILNRICSIFKQDIRQIMNSVVLIISKVSIQNYQLSALAKQIDSIIQSNKNITQHSKLLLNKIISRNRIALFPLPHQITKHIRQIRQKIQLLNQGTLCYDNNIVLSYKALNGVNQCKKNLNQKLQEIGNNITSQIEYNFIDSDLIDTQFRLDEKIDLLKEYINQLNDELFQSKSYYLSFFMRFLIKQMNVSEVNCEQFEKNIQMINFYNELAKTENQKQFQQYYHFITYMKMKATPLFQKLKSMKQLLQHQQQKKQLKRNYERKNGIYAQLFVTGVLFGFVGGIIKGTVKNLGGPVGTVRETTIESGVGVVSESNIGQKIGGHVETVRETTKENPLLVGIEIGQKIVKSIGSFFAN